MQPINIYGDHATCCTKNGDLVTRHNAVRNLVHSIASDGLLQPQLEKQGILGPTTGRRPGDVTIPNWKHGNGLAIDVAVTSPLTQTSLRLVNPCENYSETQKHRKYDVSFEDTDYYFCALVFETLGGVNGEGEKVLRQLFPFAAKKLGREFSSYCSRAWARVSCCLQRSIAQVILSRIDGVSAESELPSESFAVASGKPSVGEWPVGKSSVGESPVGESPVEPVGKSLIGGPSEGGQGRAELGGERRGGEGGIMNTTDKSTIRTSPLMSCKKSIGRAGPGGNKIASNSKADAREVSASIAGSRDLPYVPDTPPPFRRGSHANGRSNRVTRTRIHHTAPPRSTEGRPLLVGTLANASPNAVLPSLEAGFGAGCAHRSSGPRTPSVARGASVARERT